MESICLELNDGSLICTKMMRVPDNAYNFQSWNKYAYENADVYTSLFIDLLDDYNQYDYYYKYYNGYYKMALVPYDTICMPVSLIERIVFASKNFKQIKRELKSYIAANPFEAESYGLSKESVDKLFLAYE